MIEWAYHVRVEKRSGVSLLLGYHSHKRISKILETKGFKKKELIKERFL